MEGLQGVQHAVHQSELAAETHADPQWGQAIQGDDTHASHETMNVHFITFTSRSQCLLPDTLLATEVLFMFLLTL